ncbi:MAG: redoxin domain-containing protein [Verrucomicrobiota bacterium]
MNSPGRYCQQTIAHFAIFASFVVSCGGTELLPGHSHQGESFNEGPRQFATLEPGYGDVHFPVMTDWEDGQAFFNQGIGQLHGFLYFEAERTFRHLAAHDEDCAMAYWGMAMANWENEERAKGFIEKAIERLEGITPRERAYIEAKSRYLSGEEKDAKKRRRNLIRDHEAIIRDFPDDIEARAFLACRIWQFSKKGIEIGSHGAVDALMDPVFDANPMHPAHHYRIHLWDKEKAEVALDSAHVLGETAPEIAHMWHMPGHIYSNLHRYDDAVWAQEASSRVDHRTMAEQRVLPDRVHNYPHNNEWMVRNLIYQGDREKALTVARSLVANPRHPKLNHAEKRNSSVSYGRLRLREVLIAFEMWDELLEASAPGSPWLDPVEGDLDYLDLQVARGLAQLFTDQNEEFTETLAGVEALLEKQEKLLAAKRKEAREKAESEEKEKKELEEAIAAAVKAPQEKRKKIIAARDQLRLVQMAADGKLEEALKDAKKIAKFFPPVKTKLFAGNKKRALEFVKDPAPGQTLPCLARIECLWSLGRKNEAKKAFEDLQAIAYAADLSSPPFRRLSELAAEARWIDSVDADWRGPVPVREDTGTRPNLESLGPMAWEPPLAPDIWLLDEDLNGYRLADFRGRPVILIFYLGHGCLHCIEQLNVFAPEVEKFREAGLEVVAVSTDDVLGLEKSQKKFTDELADRFPFLLLANPQLDAFHAYRAYDDFEQQPLHGTFLIDAAGRILWSDTGPEPFSEPEFLLREGRRLLEIYPAKNVAAR